MGANTSINRSHQQDGDWTHLWTRQTATWQRARRAARARAPRGGAPRRAPPPSPHPSSAATRAGGRTPESQLSSGVWAECRRPAHKRERWRSVYNAMAEGNNVKLDKDTKVELKG